MPKYQRPWQHADRHKPEPVPPPGLRPPNDGVTDWRRHGPAAQVLSMPAPEPKPRPVLEVNRLPGQHLAELVEKIGEAAVARQLNVHPKTLYRWLTGRTPLPGRQHLAIKLLLGDLPGTDGAWRGWRFWGGKLLSPAGEAYDPGEILAIGLNRQRVTALEREVHGLRERLQIAEKAVEVLSPAANETRAWG